MKKQKKREKGRKRENRKWKKKGDAPFEMETFLKMFLLKFWMICFSAFDLERQLLILEGLWVFRSWFVPCPDVKTGLVLGTHIQRKEPHVSLQTWFLLLHLLS